MHISIELDTGPLALALQELATRDVGWACADAMNVMAEEIHDDLVKRMNVNFDRPTDYTLKAFRVIKATERRQEAAVAQKDIKRYSGRDYLRVQEEGGPRPQKGFERQLSRALAFEGVIQSVIPGDNAEIDAHGNWNYGELRKVLSQLQAGREAGYTSNETATSKKRKSKKGEARYFVGKVSAQTHGIYRRFEGARRDDVGVMAVFSEKVPTYPVPRLGFEENAKRLFSEKMTFHLAEKLAAKIAKRFG